MRAEWAKPAANRQCSQDVKKLYNLPPFVSEILQVPLVDAPVLAIQSSGLLSEDSQGNIKDAWDRRVDTALRRYHEATTMACTTASVVSRASIVLGGKMLELLPVSESRLREGASRMLKATSFTADATLDALIFSSRAVASSTVARRGIWLRAWQADIHSKQIVTGYPFQVEKLFGSCLYRILIETRDKKKALPRFLCKTDRKGQGNYSFRGQQIFQRSRFDNRHQGWTSPRPQFKRTNFGNRGPRQRFQRGDRQDWEPKTKA